MKYTPQKIEKKWQKYWENNATFKNYSRKERFYALDMFPYPSGAGLHVGHPKGYIATDIVARFEQLRGKSVLHPMGWDAFGLPTENYAIKNKIHPSIATAENIKVFKSQLEKIGFTYDWDREINTTDPEYYRWTQWIFLKMFEKGLAYESYEPINWCPSCKTGLANEDLEDGKCERCGSQVEQRPMRQWVLKMTEYADRLLQDLDTEGLDWEKSIVDQQKNWIGRSEGVEVLFDLRPTANDLQLTTKDQRPTTDDLQPTTHNPQSITVFTTRVDTIFGCAYIVLAPEHEQISNLKSQISNWGDVEVYIEQAKKKTNLQRTDLAKEKTGVRLAGVEAINPFNGGAVPVFVADYVLGGYGTGAVMAVPAHDERDLEFAKKYHLPIKETVIQKLALTSEQRIMLENYEREGKKYFYRSDTNLHEDTAKWVDFLRKKLSPKMSIIEVGAGNGWFADYCKKFGLDVECTDVVDTFVSYLRQSGKKSRKLDLLQDSLGIEWYDCVVAFSVLHHFTEEQFWAILGKIHRSLRKNGLLALRVKRGTPLDFTDSFEGIKVFYKYWKEEELQKILEKRGYVLESMEVNPSKTHVSIIARKVGESCFTEDGILIDSGEFTGLSSSEARERMMQWLEKTGNGKQTVNYKMRDWVFSRQRYWGEPIPIVHCEGCAKKKVLILHGWEDSSISGWIPSLKENLEQKGYKVYAFDAPNTNTPNFDEWYEFIDKKIQEIGSENLTIVGHSMGGHLATKFAEKYVLDRLVLVSPVGFSPSDRYFKQFSLLLSKRELEIFQEFQDRDLSVEDVKKNVSVIEMFFGGKDGWITEEIVRFYQNAFEDVARITILNDKGHMSEGEGVKKLSELENVFSVAFKSVPIIIPEKDLPVRLPEVTSYEPTGTGESPLAGISEWVNTICPRCGGPAKRETNTMPQWAGSSWYYLRYIDSKNDTVLADPKVEKDWMPVDLYVGGAEHATRHLLYARFWHKFLYDIGVVSTKEPFKRLVHVGLINAADGRKMSKRWNNVINPDDVIAEFGADSLRLYEMFMGPFTQNISWNTEGVSGVRRFLEKIFRFFEDNQREGDSYMREWVQEYKGSKHEMADTGEKIKRELHKTIKKVTEDIEEFCFNTAISQLMIFLNSFYRTYDYDYTHGGVQITKDMSGFLRGSDFKKFVILLSPFAPHIAEELWEKMGHTKSIFLETWPTWDEKLIIDEQVTLVVQVNGKVRDTLTVSADISESDAKTLALQSEKVKKFTDQKEIRKVIFVKGKLINIVI